MTDNPGHSSVFKRIAPWLLAIAVGLGVGWWIGGTSAPERPEAAGSKTDARPAPPPVASGGAAPARAEPLGPPITLAISNRNCNWGADYQGYYRQAATILIHTGEQAGRHAEAVRVRVPDRPWNGLTVTAIEAVDEGSGIIFAEPLAQVRAALAAAGVRLADDGGIPLDGDTATVQAIGATSGSAVRYGGTVLTCGA